MGSPSFSLPSIRSNFASADRPPRILLGLQGHYWPCDPEVYRLGAGQASGCVSGLGLHWSHFSTLLPSMGHRDTPSPGPAQAQPLGHVPLATHPAELAVKCGLGVGSPCCPRNAPSRVRRQGWDPADRRGCARGGRLDAAWPWL